MGLATSQVRLLALTSRKSDVEFRMQLNAKRKTMLMRESTTLSKLYYAKLQQARYQYSTEEGYNDVTYGYVMGVKNDPTEPTIDSIKNGTYTTDQRNLPGAFIIDSSGNAVVNDDLFESILNAYNSRNTSTSAQELILKTLNQHLTISLNTTPAQKGDLKNISSDDDILEILYKGSFDAKDYTGKDLPVTGNLFNDLGTILKFITNDNLNGIKTTDSQGVNPGYYIYQKDSNTYNLCYINKGNDADNKNATTNTLFKDGQLLLSLTKDDFNSLKELGRLYDYYGDMLNYIFENNGLKLAGTLVKDEKNSTATLIKYDVEASSNSAYHRLLDTNYLQEAFRSGAFTIMSIDNEHEAQGLDYFINKSYFVEKADTESRETITAWFNAKKAELDEKETYWDSEINALSTELETINTEMESIKALRDNAIQTTFKWGAA